jgi:hypothetical protein
MDSVVGANFAQSNNISNDMTKSTLNHQNNGRFEFARDIIIGLGLVISSGLAVAAYFQSSPILLFSAAVVAIASVGLFIIRCISNRKREEVVNEKDLGNKQRQKSDSINQENINITKSEIAVVEKPVIHLKEDGKSFFEGSDNTQGIDTGLTSRWTEEVQTDFSFTAMPLDQDETHFPLGLPPFVVPNTSDTLNTVVTIQLPSDLPPPLLPGDLPPSDLPPFFPTIALASMISPALQEQNSSSSSSLFLSNDKTFSINEETTDCSAESKVNQKKGLYEDRKVNSSNIILARKSKSLNSMKALPITPPRITRNVTQPSISLNSVSHLSFGSISSQQANDLPPADLPPLLPTIHLVPKIAHVLKEQIDTEKTFRKNMVCGTKIIQKIIDHEVENQRICDPIFIKMHNYY